MLRNQVSSVSSLSENKLMPCSTVAEFAYELRKTPETLFGQLKSADVLKTAASDLVSEADKQSLLDFLKASHGTAANAERKKITIVKKSTIEIKQADATGRARTIEVEVRRKRTFIHRDEGHPAVPEQMQQQAESEVVFRNRTDRRSAALNALANYQIIRRHGSTMPFEPNEIVATMEKSFHDAHSIDRGQLASESHSKLAFKWPTSWHLPVHERSVQLRRMGGCMGRRRRLDGAMSQGFFSSEKSNLRNAP